MRSGMQGLVAVAVLAAVMITGTAKAESAGADGKPDLRPVDNEALQLLSPPITLKLTDTNVASALNWAAKLSGTTLPIVVWPQQATKKVSLAITDAPLAQVLRSVEEQTGSVHRFRDGKIHLLMPDEVAAFEKGEEPQPAAKEKGETAVDIDQSSPQGVSDEADLLKKKVPLELVNMPLAEALSVLTALTQIPTEADQSVGQIPVTFKLANTTIAEVMTQIKEIGGGEHRVVNGVIRIASHQQWKAIDAGKAKFAKAKTIPVAFEIVVGAAEDPSAAKGRTVIAANEQVAEKDGPRLVKEQIVEKAREIAWQRWQEQYAESWDVKKNGKPNCLRKAPNMEVDPARKDQWLVKFEDIGRPAGETWIHLTLDAQGKEVGKTECVWGQE